MLRFGRLAMRHKPAILFCFETEPGSLVGILKHGNSDPQDSSAWDSRSMT